MKKNSKMKRITLWFPMETWEKIKRLARKLSNRENKDISASALIREAVQIFLKGGSR